MDKPTLTDPEKDGLVKKQKRASRPKVKTGCNNCKIRRVKCDETRPQCLKCVRAGRTCEGYPAYRRTVDIAIPIAPRPEAGSLGSSISSGSFSSTSSSGSPPATNFVSRIKPRVGHASRARKTRQVETPAQPAEQYLSPRQTPKSISLTLYQPGGFPLDSLEGQYFQVFRTHTASELSGFFDSDFWQRSVLQESHSEASIRHSVVALGALYKTLEKAAESPPGSPDDKVVDTAQTHHTFALQQYGKALKRMRESLDNKEPRSNRTELISIVLLTCFGSFTGDHKAAIIQIQHGLELLESRRQDSAQPLFRKKEDVVEDELVQMFTRLAVQAKSYDMAFHFPPPYVIRLSQPTRADPTTPQSQTSPTDSSTSTEAYMPETFSNVQEARTSIDSLCERIMRFGEVFSSYHHGPNNILPKSVMSSARGFGVQLKQWAKAFAPLLESRHYRGVSSTERAGINVLKMLQLMTWILFNSTFSTSEMEFDKFNLEFKEIVELAGEVVVEEELNLAQARCGSISTCRHRDPSSNDYNFPGLAWHRPGPHREEQDYTHLKASFALDLGIVPPLFVVATKCRDRKLRREAIRLLMASPRREGMWDSILSGRVGQWIMTVEESQLLPWDGPNGRAARQVVSDDRRVMVKEILFDMLSREATLRCGTRGAREGDLDHRAKETHISW